MKNLDSGKVIYLYQYQQFPYQYLIPGKNQQLGHTATAEILRISTSLVSVSAVTGEWKRGWQIKRQKFQLNVTFIGFSLFVHWNVKLLLMPDDDTVAAVGDGYDRNY